MIIIVDAEAEDRGINMRLTSKPSQYGIFYVEKVWNTTIILESESEQTLVTSCLTILNPVFREMQKCRSRSVEVRREGKAVVQVTFLMKCDRKKNIGI